MSYFLYLGLPKPPFELDGVFPDVIQLTDATDEPIGRAVLGSSRHGKVYCVTHCGYSHDILGRAHKSQNCDRLVLPSIARLEATHRKVYFLVHWATDALDPEQVAAASIECPLAEFLELFPRLEPGVRYVVRTTYRTAYE